MGIYLDHHAATPVGEGARAAMDEAREHGWANPASVHAAGRASRALLERGRDRIAAAIGAAPAEIVLTSGGTEACNLAVRGLVRAGHVVTTAIEHPAIAESVGAVAGSRVTRLAVPHGRPPSEDDVSSAITPDTALMVVQWVNHETGTVLPVARYAEICRARGVPFVVDATQALGKIAIDVRALGATALALASHKVGGPGGAGALWIARDAPEVSPLILGGAQERGRRAGSPEVIAIAGFGGACAEVDTRLAGMQAIAARRDRIERALVSLGAVINAPAGERVATCVSASVRGWRGSALVAALDLEGLEIASGAACSSGLDRPSPVIAAMHADEPWRASAALRISLGPETSDDEVARAIAILERVLSRAPA